MNFDDSIFLNIIQIFDNRQIIRLRSVSLRFKCLCELVLKTRLEFEYPNKDFPIHDLLIKSIPKRYFLFDYGRDKLHEIKGIKNIIFASINEFSKVLAIIDSDFYLHLGKEDSLEKFKIKEFDEEKINYIYFCLYDVDRYKLNINFTFFDIIYTYNIKNKTLEEILYFKSLNYEIKNNDLFIEGHKKISNVKKCLISHCSVNYQYVGKKFWILSKFNEFSFFTNYKSEEINIFRTNVLRARFDSWSMSLIFIDGSFEIVESNKMIKTEKLRKYKVRDFIKVNYGYIFVVVDG